MKAKIISKITADNKTTDSITTGALIGASTLLGVVVSGIILTFIFPDNILNTTIGHLLDFSLQTSDLFYSFCYYRRDHDQIHPIQNIKKVHGVEEAADNSNVIGHSITCDLQCGECFSYRICYIYFSTSTHWARICLLFLKIWNPW